MISVIVPTLNEAENLPKCLAAVRKNEGPCELLVVDGGSTDETREIAARCDAQVIRAPVRQRAAQLNLGAMRAAGSILLFLHADTLLPPSALQRIRASLTVDGVGGGAFARRFDLDSIFLRFTCGMAEVRNRVIGWHLGDQAIFAKRTCFEQLGGYRLLDQFEDLDFSRRLAASTRIVTLRPPVISSARRFAKEGPVNRTVRDLFLTVAYLRSGPEATRKTCGVGETQLSTSQAAK